MTWLFELLPGINELIEIRLKHPPFEVIEYIFNSHFLVVAVYSFVLYLFTCVAITGLPKYFRILWILLKKFYYKEGKFYPILYLVVGTFYAIVWITFTFEAREVFFNYSYDSNNFLFTLTVFLIIPQVRILLLSVPKFAIQMMNDINWRLNEIEDNF